MRSGVVAAASVLALAIAGVANAQSASKPTWTEDKVVCQLSGSCDEAASADLDSDVTPAGKEASFNIGRSKPTATPAAAAKAAPVRAASIKTVSRSAGAGSTPMVTRRADGSRALDMTITFDTGSATMTADGRRNAEAFALALAKHPELAGKGVMIEGHTDRVGDRGYNIELSQARAQAVADFLASKGVSASLLRTKGFGFDRPIDGLSPYAAQNRRVELVRSAG
ncbi:OmpA family protein [Sphingomonas crocodyli]|uniref:OmpA family protein n=1 Tax=Sphingomonas crocodyli TaxID=1979270 RepID=A0A437LVU1_9SPHN|nr:OmpA family protein [Sphingomonas crocodyli]RVT89492.1 OmpA family protein [Sphingomonas crocodyli]